MRVLVTRPRGQNERLAAILQRSGHEPILSPLMEVRFIEGGPLDLAGVQAVLATSASGIRAFAERTPDRDIPVFAVGSQTASVADGLGFDSVKDAQGDALNLAEAVSLWASPDAGVLLHPTASDHAPHLASVLGQKGFQVRTEHVYETITTPALTDEAVSHLHAQTLDAAMLFSPRSARLFVAAIDHGGLRASVKALRAICISAATAQPLHSLGLRAISIASAPNQDSMLALLEKSP